MLASAVVRLGAGMLVTDPGPQPDFQKWITELIAQPRFHQAAAAFQEKYRAFNKQQQLDNIVARCEQLLRT